MDLNKCLSISLSLSKYIYIYVYILYIYLNILYYSPVESNVLTMFPSTLAIVGLFSMFFFTWKERNNEILVCRNKKGAIIDIKYQPLKSIKNEWFLGVPEILADKL